jgi:hypothetical protein
MKFFRWKKLQYFFRVWDFWKCFLDHQSKKFENSRLSVIDFKVFIFFIKIVCDFITHLMLSILDWSQLVYDVL